MGDGPAEWAGPLEIARKHPLDEALLREQFGRLGDTPFELARIDIDLPEPVMTPKSVLNDLRRQCASQLIAARAAATRSRRIDRAALDNLRATARAFTVPRPGGGSDSPRLSVLVRSLEQLQATIDWAAAAPAAPTGDGLLRL